MRLTSPAIWLHSSTRRSLHQKVFMVRVSPPVPRVSTQGAAREREREKERERES